MALAATGICDHRGCCWPQSLAGPQGAKPTWTRVLSKDPMPGPENHFLLSLLPLHPQDKGTLVLKFWKGSKDFTTTFFY